MMRRFYAEAGQQDIEVSFLLAVGNLLLVSTYERLTKHEGYNHRQGYRAALTEDQQKAFDALLWDSFVSSKTLWRNGGRAPEVWQKGSLDNDWLPQEPDCWIDPNGRYLIDKAAFPMVDVGPGKSDPGLTVGAVIGILRNALAHGDVVFASDGSAGQIGRVVFVASKEHPAKMKGHEFVATTPAGFKALIEAWRDVLPQFGYQAPDIAESGST
ncbi:MAG: hypothetical protein EXQ85_06675 [Alphaproteobacteria bacterium]|nr:hypothetical protein [Alphaproteobacteria bacterium]